eukprot:2264732-Pyramimonas_sp.AAC.1
MPLPAAVPAQEAALLARLWHTAHCALPRGGWFNLGRWNGPAFSSLVISTSAALIRSSLVTIESWRTLMPLLRRSADDRLPYRRVLGGELSPSFWSQPSFAEFLESASLAFPRPIGHDLVTSSPAS